MNTYQSHEADALSTCAHEDICRLNEILRSQKCISIIRDTHGRTVAGELDSPMGAAAISAPIFDPEGCVRASIDIIQDEPVNIDSTGRLLRALAEAVARSIAERWFRLAHRRLWVVAAMRRCAPGTTIILAVDRNQRIIGADRHARALLEQVGSPMRESPSVCALFRVSPNLLRRRQYGEASSTLFTSFDGEPWVVLITPPDMGVVESPQDARVLLHARPRLDSLIHLSSMPTSQRTKRGLSQGALQRIQEYIEANLDSALEIDELAAIVRMSSSHFTRTFHRSVGVTPHRYVIHNRVMRARELLTTSSLPLTDIALTTGFSDQSHFSRRFQEVVGIPPGAFRGHEGRFVADSVQPATMK